MKNIKNYKKRFFSLLESTMGDVRPILSEQPRTPKKVIDNTEKIVKKQEVKKDTASKKEVVVNPPKVDSTSKVVDVKKLVPKSLSDYHKAYDFCKSVQDFWEGSSNIFYSSSTQHTNFFKKFQAFNDPDDQAAIAYGQYINMELDSKIDKTNTYYNDIKKWIDSIVDNIDDWFQTEQWIHISHPQADGKKYPKQASFKVDPEIDV